MQKTISAMPHKMKAAVTANTMASRATTAAVTAAIKTINRFKLPKVYATDIPKDSYPKRAKNFTVPQKASKFGMTAFGKKLNLFLILLRCCNNRLESMHGSLRAHTQNNATYIHTCP